MCFLQVFGVVDVSGFAVICYIVWVAVLMAYDGGADNPLGSYNEKSPIRVLGKPLSSRWIYVCRITSCFDYSH